MALYALPQFTPMTVGATTGASASVQEAHAPHSLVLHSFGHGGDSSPQLLIGLADGSLVTYSITDAGLLANRRASSLGNDRPVSFAPCAYFEAQKDDRVVLASASRGAIMWFDRKAKRLRTSTVAIKVCPFDECLLLSNQFYPGCRISLRTRPSIVSGFCFSSISRCNDNRIHRGT